jgi:hypothetical protein
MSLSERVANAACACRPPRGFAGTQQTFCAATQPIADNDLPVPVDTVNFKNILRQIKTYPNNLQISSFIAYLPVNGTKYRSSDANKMSRALSRQLEFQ